MIMNIGTLPQMGLSFSSSCLLFVVGWAPMVLF
jgi:hypothetical protein